MDIRRDIPHWWKLIGIVCMVVVLFLLILNNSPVWEPNLTIRFFEVIAVSYGILAGFSWFVKSVNDDTER